MTKILVTGGAGYIGSVLVPELVKSQYQVTVLDSFMYNQQSLLDCCHYPNLTLIRGDARNEALLKSLIAKAEIIIPLACIVGAPACDIDPIKATSTNLDAIRLILKLRSKYQVIIFPNTNSGYGIKSEEVHCTEESPLNPISLYGRLKVQAEKEIIESGYATVFRLATVFGISPRMRLDLLVNDFVYKAVTERTVTLFESHFKRNYIHIRDVVRVFLYCLDHFSTSMHDQIYNIGLSNANLSKLELCEKIKEQLPQFYFHEAPVGEDPDKRNYIVSNLKIEMIGFKPQFSIEGGITELIKGYQIIRRNQFTNV